MSIPPFFKFLMSSPKAKLKINSEKVSPYFKPFITFNVIIIIIIIIIIIMMMIIIIIIIIINKIKFMELKLYKHSCHFTYNHSENI
jgi:hypothetical protein